MLQFQRTLFPGPNPPEGCDAQPGGSLVCRFTPPDEPTSIYVYDPGLVLALNVALATRRPLLLAGEPGSGKTTLARNVAHVLGWASYRHTVGSRTQAGELLWELDTLRRLNDAYDPKRRLLHEDAYIEPGLLWWALAPKSARRRGLQADAKAAPPPGVNADAPAAAPTAAPGAAPSAALDDAPPAIEPAHPPSGHREADGAVLLIDEIDKAEPDVPNDLLEVLDTRSFTLRGRTVRAEREQVLVIITTNLERELPGAFMRRCVVHRLADSEPPWFSAIAARVLPEIGADLAQAVEARLAEYRRLAAAQGTRRPGTAEYLDALRALHALGLTDTAAAQADPAWAQVERCVFGKQAQVDTAR